MKATHSDDGRLLRNKQMGRTGRTVPGPLIKNYPRQRSHNQKPLLPGVPKDVVLADVARGTNLSISAVSRILRGERRPRMETAARIAAYFGMTIGEFYEAIA